MFVQFSFCLERKQRFHTGDTVKLLPDTQKSEENQTVPQQHHAVAIFAQYAKIRSKSNGLKQNHEAASSPMQTC